MDKIVIYGYAIICGGLGILTTVYFVFESIRTACMKFYRKAKFGKTLFD